MCGVTGCWDRRTVGAKVLGERVRGMTDTLRHRGPDDAGVFVDAEAGIALGTRRLAIMDLSAHGHQPMESADGRYVVTYNGEVYNFAKLRSELEGAGHRFRGGSDTEVLVAAIERWGMEQALVRSNGMFGLAVWDRRDQKLRLARDRFGEKPLYYGWAGSAFVFGSELKALRAHPGFSAEIDRDALALYFRHNCIPSPFSIYRGVAKLTAGNIVTIERSTHPGHLPEPVPYWSLTEVVDVASRSRAQRPIDEVLDELDGILGDAVALRMGSDVPLGALLSGGIDSSLVVAMMQRRQAAKVRTFTIGFDDAAYDEAAYARRVANHLGTEHMELSVTARDAIDVIPSLPRLYDEPFADSSQIPTAMLAALTRRHVTVALSGDGGDEMFGGYNRYVWAEHFWRRVRHVPAPLRRWSADALAALSPDTWDRVLGRAAPVLPRRLRVRNPGTKVHKVARVLPAADLGQTYLALVSQTADPTALVLGAREPATILSTPASWPQLTDPVELMSYLDTMTYLPDDILTKVDRATMGVSLEARLPFLDPDVAAFAWRLPSDHKVRDGTGKWLLRRLLHRYVPAELVERPKAGFGVPLGSWLRSELRPWATDLLAPDRLRSEGLLDAQTVQRLWTEHLSGRRDRAHDLWGILMFETWLAATTPR